MRLVGVSDKRHQLYVWHIGTGANHVERHFVYVFTIWDVLVCQGLSIRPRHPLVLREVQPMPVGLSPLPGPDLVEAELVEVVGRAVVGGDLGLGDGNWRGG